MDFLCLALILFVLCLLILFAIKPNRKRLVKGMKGRAFAHRGLHDQEVPENSLAAFRAAKEQGYPVELDVQYTKDKQVVVFHDPVLTRMCGIEKRVAELSYEELSAYPLKNTEEHIPLFSEVLKVLDGTDIICEIKDYAGPETDALCRDTYSLFQHYRGRVFVESFAPRVLYWFRKNQPQVIRGQLSRYGTLRDQDFSAVSMFLLRTLMVNLRGRPDFIAYDFHKQGLCCRLCRKLFHPVFVVWTARGEEEQKIAKKGADAIIFEKNPISI